MKIHKEGYSIIRNEILFIILFICLTIYIPNKIIITLLILSSLIFLLSIYFFRVPFRTLKNDNGLIYAPCDGKIVVIEETYEDEYFMDDKIQISIFMSPLNVHNQLYPISGEIVYKKYHPGKFLFAWNPKASNDNESCSVVIKNKNISILCKQIAGALARRIKTYSNIDEKVSVGQELGFIKFGSRVDLFLPRNTKVHIKLDDKVIAGKSVIGSLKK